MNHQIKKALITAAAICSLLGNAAQACTGIRLIAADGTVVHARTMEFAIDIHSDVIVVPRGYARIGNHAGRKRRASSGRRNTPASGPMASDCRSCSTG